MNPIGSQRTLAARARQLTSLFAAALALSCASATPAPDAQGAAPETRGSPEANRAPARAQSGSAAAQAEPAAPAPAPRKEADVAAAAREPEVKLTQAEARAALEADSKAFEAPLELVESAPVETSLDHADVRDAKDVWPAMINRASARIDVAEFYLSNEAGSALEPSLAALEAAAARGVHIRLLADSKMAKEYPETIARLQGKKNVEVEQIDFHVLAGGVQHAKYFVVDGSEAYEGSQNFDWRSLTQIQEMGLRFRAPEAVRALEDVFETDWALAGGAPKTTRATPKGAYRFPTASGSKDGATLTFVASPKGWLPDEATWDLPAMVQLIDGAKASVKVQVLTYRSHNKKESFSELEDALKRAAARGVSVTLLVSHWSLRKGVVEGLQQLVGWRPGSGAQGRPIEVRVLTIPELGAGYLPFARVAHAKYMVVDGAKAWVGTNNWERDYFLKTRNVGLIVDGGAVPPRLDQIFEQNLASPYSAHLDPNRSYEQPHTGP